MNLEPVLTGLIFSDLVIREQGTKKFSLIGCFNNYSSNTFPFIVPGFFATALISNIKGNHESLNVTLRVEAPESGHVLTSTSATVRLIMGVTFSGDEVLDLPFPLRQFVVQEPGVYQILVLVNNEKIGSRPLGIQGPETAASD
jgi:hypothetical protein